ncbi:unnamed protein product, partial [Heterobilharzia americana]
MRLEQRTSKYWRANWAFPGHCSHNPPCESTHFLWELPHQPQKTSVSLRLENPLSATHSRYLHQFLDLRFSVT